MGSRKKLLSKILSGGADANIPFAPLCGLLDAFGFSQRIRGDHHIFWKSGVEEILNIQPKGAKAKAYQVKQVRDLIISYRLTLGDDDDD